MAWSSGLRESERRPLRVFAFDPMVDRFRPPIVLRVPFEHVEPGPVGRLVAVADVDTMTGRGLPPLDLDDPEVLIGSGIAPSETDFRSHQQMVYAVAMAVLEAFERGLGRPIVWHAGKRLRLVPHAMSDANAWFQRETFSVMFGAFRATGPSPGANLAGQTIYSCLSWDVVAHEACHPVLSDLRPFESGLHDTEPVRSPDTFALYEGLCDLLALLVRLTDRSVVLPMVREYGLDFQRSPLFSLASQFGQAAGIGTALRSFPAAPAPASSDEPHLRGVTFTSAVIEAFLGTLRQECGDLFGLHGPPRSDGWLHPDLVGRLAGQANQLARGVMDVCIGAIDLLPPFDTRFGDFLRAAVTVSVERFGPRQAVFRARLIEAFRVRAMAPTDVDSLALDALVLERAEENAAIRLPHVDEALMLTQHALELRRACMTDSARIEGAAAVVRGDLRRLKRWHRDVGAFATRHARRLGLDGSRPMRVENLTGAFGLDASDSVAARVVVQIEQAAASAAGSRRGVTIVANSTGELQYVVRARQRGLRRAATKWPYRRVTTDRDLVAPRVGEAP
jgi:hypothetical protein